MGTGVSVFPIIVGARAPPPAPPELPEAGGGAGKRGGEGAWPGPRHKIPVTAIVFHNRQWGAEKKNQVDFYGRRFVADELEGQDFVAIAQAMGAEGIKVSKLEDVGPALTKAVDAQMNAGVTTVVEIMCTRELGDPFRRDALSTPVRHLEKYRDYV